MFGRNLEQHNALCGSGTFDETFSNSLGRRLLSLLSGKHGGENNQNQKASKEHKHRNYRAG